MNFEQFLRMKIAAINNNQRRIEMSPTFKISVIDENDDGVYIKVYVDGYNGITLDFIVIGNQLIQRI